MSGTFNDQPIYDGFALGTNCIVDPVWAGDCYAFFIRPDSLVYASVNRGSGTTLGGVRFYNPAGAEWVLGATAFDPSTQLYYCNSANTGSGYPWGDPLIPIFDTLEQGLSAVRRHISPSPFMYDIPSFMAGLRTGLKLPRLAPALDWPDHIAIKTLPTHEQEGLVYHSGDLIDATGLSCEIYNADGSLWINPNYPHSTVEYLPDGELSIDPIRANDSEATETGEYDVTGLGLNPPVYLVPLRVGMIFSHLRIKSLEGEPLGIVSQSGPIMYASIVSWLPSRITIDRETGGFPETYVANIEYTNEHGTCYYSSPRVSMPGPTDIPLSGPTNGPGYTGAIALLGGTPKDQQTVTVKWPRFGDGRILTTTFDIKVLAPKVKPLSEYTTEELNPIYAWGTGAGPGYLFYVEYVNSPAPENTYAFVVFSASIPQPFLVFASRAPGSFDAGVSVVWAGHSTRRWIDNPATYDSTTGLYYCVYQYGHPEWDVDFTDITAANCPMFRSLEEGLQAI